MWTDHQYPVYCILPIHIKGVILCNIYFTNCVALQRVLTWTFCMFVLIICYASGASRPLWDISILLIRTQCTNTALWSVHVQTLFSHYLCLFLDDALSLHWTISLFLTPFLSCLSHLLVKSPASPTLARCVPPLSNIFSSRCWSNTTCLFIPAT